MTDVLAAGGILRDVLPWWVSIPGALLALALVVFIQRKNGREGGGGMTPAVMAKAALLAVALVFLVVVVLF